MLFSRFNAPLASPLRQRRGDFAGASASTRDSRPIASPNIKNVWVVCPENGHAYKRIQCEDWIDAQTQATAERGYLVTINDETEQKWLQAVFGGQPSWIGLNDIAQEGQWTWDNGEPLTYTNWGLQEPGDTQYWRRGLCHYRSFRKMGRLWPRTWGYIPNSDSTD